MTFSNQTIKLDAGSDTTVQATSEMRSRAMSGAQLTEYVQTLYSVLLYDTQNSATFVSRGLDPAGRTANAEYFFRVPPKSVEFQEPFSTTIQGTQSRGKYVESYGSIIKSLRVSGTTGLRPNKVATRTQPLNLLGISDEQLSILAGDGLRNNVNRVSPDEKTGWDDIIFLRNIFRKYSDIKDIDDLAGRVVMLWRNLKDGDYWVVEPEDFRISQNSQSPLTYEYSISFKTLAKFDFTFTVNDDPLEASRDTARLLSRVQEYGQNIMNMYMSISTQITRVQGFATFLSNAVLAPMLNVVNGLTAIRTTSFGVSRGLRTQVDSLISNLEDAEQKLRNLGSLDPQDPLIRSLRRARVACYRVVVEPVVRESSVTDTTVLINRYAAAYERPGTLTTPRRAPVDSPSYIGYEALPETVGSDIVYPGETLRDVATRLLGDPSRWRILATLNRLRAPFVTVVGGAGLLRPGDTVLYPRASTTKSNIIGSVNVTDDQYTGPDDPVVRAYGRDLRLKVSYVGGQELYDLDVSQNGDLATIQGQANVEQALNIKFLTERGELPAHPKFGAKVRLGSKATPVSFNEFRINTLNTLRSDSRVSLVSDLQFTASGDKLFVKAAVVLVGSQSALPLTLPVRGA